MATCGSCGGLGGKVTVGGWVQCGSCGGSGQRFRGQVWRYFRARRSA